MAFSPKAKRMSVACDGGQIMIFDLESYEKVGQVTAQKEEITALLYSRPDQLVIGQDFGYLDVLSFGSAKVTVTHSLCIKAAGDINDMVVGKEAGEFLVACEKGLLLGYVNTEGVFDVK